MHTNPARRIAARAPGGKPGSGGEPGSGGKPAPGERAWGRRRLT